MNVAKRIRAYYESEEYSNCYLEHLRQRFHDNETDILRNIRDIICHDYNWEKQYDFNKFFTESELKPIYEYIKENPEKFTKRYSGYYVGSTSIESIVFGEVCENLLELLNHKTNKPYNFKYLKRIFEAECFIVNDDKYAYYDMTDAGLHIDLLGDTIPKEIINNLKSIKSISI